MFLLKNKIKLIISFYFILTKLVKFFNIITQAAFRRCFSTLNNVDRTSVPDVETTSKQRSTMLIQRCIKVIAT